MLTAQGLGATEAKELQERIAADAFTGSDVMLQMILGYIFATLTGILALIGFYGVCYYSNRGEIEEIGRSFFMFVTLAIMSIFFAWIGGV